MTVPTRTLNSGSAIPQLGLGVWAIDPSDTQRVVEEALEIGYRHIDTAAAYGNEEGVGKAIAASGVPRGEIFVTTKLPNHEHGTDVVRDSFRASLDRLGLDAVDLYLIHWPVPSGDRYVETWQTFEELAAEGLIRSIGVSNFLPEHLERLLTEADTVPAVNQIELHPIFQQRDVVEYSRSKGIEIEGWSPLGSGKYDLAGMPGVSEAAQAHGKTPAQVVLRWHLQRDVIVFPKSTHSERLRQNFDLFDFELTNEELAAIDALDRGERIGGDPREVD
ncbi:aldo/keto reductase [Lysobacter korlensis]|uniref:Aldo/keto reductase n=1 Tax=Lysobacter korlensis TaxID=553636 RepID=A0ABV6RVK6_9GAMM